MPATDDDRRMAMAAAGETHAFGEIVRGHQGRLLRYAERMLGSRDAAHDAVQEAFLRLWGARFRYCPEGRLELFLLRIVRNICRDMTRAVSRSSADDLTDGMLDPSPGPEARAQISAVSIAVRSAVLALPAEQREVFVLTHYEGFSYQQAAELLGCPVNTVASRKHAAVVTLRRRMRCWTEEEG